MTSPTHPNDTPATPPQADRDSIFGSSPLAEDLRARLAAVVESSEDAIISKTLDGIIRTWNDGATRIFGYTSEEMIGRHVTTLMPPDRVDEEARIIERLRRGERIEHYETVRVRKDGTRLDISLTISPIRDSSGVVVGASKIARDITARKQFEAERERLLEAERLARGEAERVSLLKDEFLATLSHELRTPLNAILGWSQILRSRSSAVAADEEAAEGIAVIERNARGQTKLIEDLLDMSRITSGKLRLDVQQVDLRDVVQAAVAAVRHAADSKGVQLTAVLDPLAGPVRGDPGRLQQCVWNLLSNATKFTPRGGRVEVSLARVNSHFEIAVADTGQGIKAEFLPHVFERFRQADASTTRRHGGLGLGLSIVKNLVELHGGKVRVKSPGEGQGATFIVELPRMVAHPLPDGPPQEPSTSRPMSSAAAAVDYPSLAGVTVLAVDDEADARDLIRRILEECGARVLLAASAAEALDLVPRERPDMIVSDIGMPGEDGYQLIREVRALPPDVGGRTPAAALTAFARAEDRTRALRAGYQTHVAKPVEPMELTAVVASLATRR
jgi:PAS domain S-box-containing protein